MEDLITTKQIFDYSEILDAYGVAYSPVDYYWQVGEAKQVQGWVLHLSVIRMQVQKLMQEIIPDLLAQRVPFRIVRDSIVVFNMLEGGIGYTALGKIVCIYPENESEAFRLAKWLIDRTSSFRGPHIPTDRHLGGIVYTRYGSINPIMIKTSHGEWVKHIYGVHGQLIQDPYHVPFILPEGIPWPFGEITAPKKAKGRKLLNYKYYPLFALKSDVKGNVIRALFFRRLWQIKSCLVKQGHPNMFADKYGRDIRDRLKWQYELYQVLHKDIPMPPVFDYFEEDEDTYLVMDFIKGQTLTSWISKIYKERSWMHLLSSERLQLLDQLLKILDIIGRLHKKGYIHRDITPENFLVDKKGRVFLIDMELTWSTASKPLQPPFQLGTPGHMSPEQIAAQMPTVKEDIYGVGSLIFVFLTNFYALKIIDQETSQLLHSLEFFLGDTHITACIAACWSANPSDRPSLETIVDILKDYRERTNKTTAKQTDPVILDNAPIPSEIRRVVQGALNNFSSENLLSPDCCWISQSLQREVHVGNQQVGLGIYEGWHTGMSGPLWLTALAKEVGFSVEACQTPYFHSWQYIEKNHFGRPDKISPGLYSGSSGIALALVEGLNSGLLVPDPDVLEKLRKCFSITASQPDLAEGLAGQGLALLRSSGWLDKEFVENILTSYINNLIQKQREDGSWSTYTGIDYGNSGILLFLLSYIEKYPDSIAKSSAIKGLAWLENAGKKAKSQYSWPIGSNTKSIDRWSTGLGLPGIALAFIKAYEVLKESSYRKIAEQCLTNITPYPMILDLSLASGLTGLGETYLEASRVFKDPVWQNRADWIIAILIHCYRETKVDAGHWLTITTDVTTADLFSGNGGIIHFLMRSLNPEKLAHPLYNMQK